MNVECGVVLHIELVRARIDRPNRIIAVAVASPSEIEMQQTEGVIAVAHEGMDRTCNTDGHIIQRITFVEILFYRCQPGSIIRTGREMHVIGIAEIVYHRPQHIVDHCCCGSGTIV